jgi:ABC-2 type transport system permease protein
LLNELQYRANVVIHILQSALALITGLAVIGLVFQNVGELNGWTRPELLIVLGVYTLLAGVINAVIRPNMLRLMAEVHDGTFDFVLAKPVDTQLFMSLRHIEIWKFVDVGSGVATLLTGIATDVNEVTFYRVVAFIAMLAVAIALVYCIWFVLATAAFEVVRMEQIAQVFDSVYQAGRWPVGLYPGWLRVGLTFLVPIGFAVTVPAEAISGRLEWPTIVAAIGFAAAVAIGARRRFHRVLRHYTGASA